jgi:uncharacterized membrane protein YkoI
MRNSYLRRSIVIPAIAVAAVLIAGMAAGTAFAQVQNKATTDIKGSIDVRGTMQNYIKDNLKVSFATAADTAAAQVKNGTMVSGNLGIVEGFLVYKFFIVNSDTHTGNMVIVDAGNGQVLYTSDDIQMNAHGVGMLVGHGFGGHGLKDHGFQSQGWRSQPAFQTPPKGTQS